MVSKIPGDNGRDSGESGHSVSVRIAEGWLYDTCRRYGLHVSCQSDEFIDDPPYTASRSFHRVMFDTSSRRLIVGICDNSSLIESTPTNIVSFKPADYVRVEGILWKFANDELDRAGHCKIQNDVRVRIFPC